MLSQSRISHPYGAPFSKDWHHGGLHNKKTQTMCLATLFYLKHDFAQWCYLGVVVHGEAGFSWADLCTFLVSRGFDIISKQ